MKNRILGAANNWTPYIKELKLVAGSVNASLIWQALEAKFMYFGADTFYYFITPPKAENKLYKVGNSWTEQLFFTIDELTTGFDKICTAYKSRTAFLLAEKAGDVFAGMPFARYLDREKYVIYYFRNNTVADYVADCLCTMHPNQLEKIKLPLQISSHQQKQEPKLQQCEFALFLQELQVTDFDILLQFSKQPTSKEIAVLRTNKDAKTILQKMCNYYNANPSKAANRSNVLRCFATFQTNNIDNEPAVQVLETWYKKTFNRAFVWRGKEKNKLLEILELLGKEQGDLLANFELVLNSLNQNLKDNFSLSLLNHNLNQILARLQNRQQSTSNQQQKGNRISADLLKMAFDNL